MFIPKEVAALLSPNLVLTNTYVLHCMSITNMLVRAKTCISSYINKVLVFSYILVFLEHWVLTEMLLTPMQGV